MRGESLRVPRVRLDHRPPVTLMAIDATWHRPCVLVDVSDAGAKLEVEGPVDVLKAQEFFLLLSTTGLAFRRCRLAWLDGVLVGVRFIASREARRGRAGTMR